MAMHEKFLHNKSIFSNPKNIQKWIREVFQDLSENYTDLKVSSTLNSLNQILSDDKSKIDWRNFADAYKSGYLPAEFFWAMLLIEGYEGKDRQAFGFNLLQVSADKGHQDAARCLAAIYLRGMPEIDLNPSLEKALQCYLSINDRKSINKIFNMIKARSEGYKNKDKSTQYVKQFKTPNAKLGKRKAEEGPVVSIISERAKRSKINS